MHRRETAELSVARPLHGGGYIKDRSYCALKSNACRRRLNLCGVIDIDAMHAVICDDDNIDAEIGYV